jgi:hypothetical protein
MCHPWPTPGWTNGSFSHRLLHTAPKPSFARGEGEPRVLLRGDTIYPIGTSEF